MTKSFFTVIDGQSVHVNRRGCKGRWTRASQKALEDLVNAVRSMSPEQINALADKGASASTAKCFQ